MRVYVAGLINIENTSDEYEKVGGLRSWFDFSLMNSTQEAWLLGQTEIDRTRQTSWLWCFV